MAKLILHRGDSMREFPVRGTVTIGRQSGSTIRLDEPKASRNHARILLNGKDAHIEDLDSSNGTKVNGRKISRCALRNGDTIQIGATRLQYDDESGAVLPPEEEDARKPVPQGVREDTSDPLVGTLIGGYKIQSRLGQGGMGTVYRAYQVSMERVVALKVLKKELSTNREFMRGFLQEARIAGQLTHPALVQVHDVGEDNGTLYFSMEVVEGETVNAMLKRDGKVEIAKALEIVSGVCEALAHAARHRIVHQDVKPHNIMVDKRGQVKLADLGLATLAGGGGKPSSNQPQVLMGTPHYMAPEQSQKSRIDVRTDIYALGATLFHMLTGRVPFDGPTSLVILTKHMTQERPDPRAFNVTIPPDLAELVMAMMAIEPAQRPTDPKELGSRLKELRKEHLKEADEAGKRKGRGKAVVKRKASLSPPPAAPAPVYLPRTEPPVAEPEEEKAEEERAVRESVRARPPAGPAETWKTVLLLVLVVVGLLVALPLLGPVKKLILSGSGDPAGAGKRQDPGPRKTVFVPGDPVFKTEGVSKTPDTAALKTDAAAFEELKKAIEARDRAFQSGNLTGARQALVRFRDAHPVGEAADAARQELRETERVIGEALAQMLRDAEQAASQKAYRAAAAPCTRVISADPQSAQAAKARALMARIDAEGEPRFQVTTAQADKALAAGRLDEAMRVLGEGLDFLGGTRWAEPLTVRQLQLVLANKFLKACERARQERERQGQSVPMKVPDRDGKRVDGVLREVSGLVYKAEVGGATFPNSFLKLAPDEIYLLAEALRLGTDHVGLASLFSVLKHDAQVRQELDRALKAPEQAEEALRVAAKLAGLSNLHVYDFSHWQQQGDWDAPSGSWSTQNDQYVLESAEGGDTVLRPAALGGPFSLRKARLGFEFTPKTTHEGFFIAAEFGDEKHNVIALFSAEGYRIQANAGESASVKGAWKADPALATRVELNVKDNTVSVLLNGQKGESLTAAGISEIKGTLAFHIREASCALDNIMLRNEP